MIHPVKHICIGIKSYMDIRVSEPFLKNDCRHSRLNAPCRKGMPKRMLPVTLNSALVADSLVIRIDVACRNHPVVKMIIEDKTLLVWLHLFQCILKNWTQGFDYGNIPNTCIGFGAVSEKAPALHIH